MTYHPPAIMTAPSPDPAERPAASISADEASIPGIGALLAEPAPAVSAAEAEAMLAAYYGLAGRARLLAGERDHSFHLRTRRDGGYVLKISHPAEDPAVAGFQIDALRHIAERDPALPVPRVVPGVDGRLAPRMPLPDGRFRILRLFTYLDGTMLGDAVRSALQDRNLGIFLARLGVALSDFSQANAGDDDLLWDLRNLPRTAVLMPLIADPARRRLVAAAYEAFERRVAPVLPGLPAQVAHNDMNPDNVLVSAADPDLAAGIIDFGDMIHGPLACDVAIGAAYRWSEEEHPLAGAARFLDGYASIRRLEEAEIEVLPDLIAARLAASVNIVNWQAARFPDKRDYVLRFNAEQWASLGRILSLPAGEGAGFIRRHLRETQ